MTLRIGLNPYGIPYTLGLLGLGTPRVRPDARGLDEFIEIAREIGARGLELDWRWLLPLPDDALARLGEARRADGMSIVCSARLPQQPGETLDEVIRVARATDASLIRLHLTPVLEGGRAALGSRWPALVAHVRATLVAEARKAAAFEIPIGIENHQDFGSEELLDLAAEAGDHVGLVLDTGNPFAVGEDPVAFTERAAARILHVHLKDYQAQFTDEGVRLVRCAIGDGCVPFDEIVACLSRHHAERTASLEPGALEARHIRLFTAAWWEGYPPRDARELGVALGRLQHRRIARDRDARTPWERQAPGAEIVAYELDHLRRSVANMRARGWMQEPTP